MANVLSIQQKTAVITALVEGCSVRSTVRMTGVAKGTILRLLETVGLGRWVSIFHAGGIVQGRRRDFPPNEQLLLEAHGVCSLAIVRRSESR